MLRIINVRELINSYCFVSIDDAKHLADKVAKAREFDENVQIDFSNIEIVNSYHFEYFWKNLYEKMENAEKINDNEIIVVGLSDKDLNEFYLHNESEFKVKKELEEYYKNNPKWKPNFKY